MLNVRGHRVLVKIDPPKTRVKVSPELEKLGFKVEMTKTQEKQEEVASRSGKVVNIGPTAWHAFDKSSPDWQPWCKIGDRIVFSKYSGELIEDPDTDEQLMIINDEDVQCIVEG